MTRPLRAWVDPAALGHNLRLARAAAGDAKVLAVVKADAYGHGLAHVLPALSAADAFAVASLEEALAVRAAGVTAPVVLLEGVFEARELISAADQGLICVLHNTEQLRFLETVSLPRPIRVWLKVDTGMHRLGFPPESVRGIHRRLEVLRQVRPGVVLMTHLACADDRDNPFTHRQLTLFQGVRTGLAGETSIANSAGLLGWPESRADWVRPGIMLYGGAPFQGETGPDQGLRPVMTLETRLIAVNRQPAGSTVGYGATWTCPQEMPVGVAAVGYGDGYPRHAPAGTPVLVNGRPVPLIGRVSMDMITLDLRGQPQARVGDPVILWGRGLPADVVADYAGTIAYELFCGVTRRVPRIVVTTG